MSVVPSCIYCRPEIAVVGLTEAEAKEAASSVTWTLTPDADAPDYLDDTQFPNQTEGGPLSAWLCQDGETPFFTDVATAAETVDGQVYLTVTFANQCYFGDDLSVPHSNGGSYMDVCGYFTLSAGLDGKTLGSVDLKVAPYDNFHTMSEIYDELDALVDYAAGHTDLYVEQFSMGQSQGDNGLESLDMPYLIVAKDKAAVDKWQEIKAEAESDPTALLKKLESGELHVFDVSTFTVSGENVTADMKIDAEGHLTSYMADVDNDANMEHDTEVVHDGYFAESEKRSAPYFDIAIDGIVRLDVNFG